MATVTKQHLADKLIEAGFERPEAIQVLDSTLDLVKDSLASGEHVLISSFGKFSVREKKARKGRNPKTGEEMMMAPRRVVTFHSASELRRGCRAVLDPKADEK